MELVSEYLLIAFIPKREPIPFPDYLHPQNRYKNDFWLTQDGEKIYPRQMESRHLLNTVSMLNRKHEAWEITYDRAKGDKHIMSGKIKSVNGKPINSIKNRMKTNRFSDLHSVYRGYNHLWDIAPIYMLLRREIVLRGLEEYV